MLKITQGKGNCKLVNLQQKVRMRSKEGVSAADTRKAGTKEITELCHKRRFQAPVNPG